MSKFEFKQSLETGNHEVIRAFIRDRKSYQNAQIKKSGISPLPPEYVRNMAHSLGESSSSLLALDADAPEEPKVDTVNMTARFVITTSGKDRHGDIVIPRGCVNHLKNYTRNPRVFFAHKTEELPIASARDPDGNLALEILEDKIYSTAYFHGETRESELIFRLIARKELQASSIGFLPIRASLIESEEEDLIDLETGEEILDFRSGSTRQTPCLRFLEWDMIEWSVVPIPANQDALAAHLSRGHIEGEKISPSIKRALSLFIPQKKTVSLSLAMVPDNPYPEDSESPEKVLEAEIEKELEAELKDLEKGDSKPDPEKLDEVFKSYKKETNMSYSSLKQWSESPCSKRASLSSGPITRNLELLSTAKDKWTSKHVTWANKTIAFNSRMRGMPRGKPLSEECPWSKRDISLKNWAWDPGKTPKAKKEVADEITHQSYAGPSPGIDFPLFEKGDAPAPPKDQITGSDTNKPGSASDDKGKIEINESTKKTLQTKVDEHNEKMSGKPTWAKTTLNAVKAVYRRGAGAFSTSHRPNMTRAQWAFARVNAFLYLCKNGKPENKNYVSDNDLLHKDHPKFSKEKKSTESFESKGIPGFSLLGKLLTKEYKAVLSEVRMAMAVLLHLQEGLLPEKIKFGVYTALAKHYKLLDITYPDYRYISSLGEIQTTFPEIDIKEFHTVATNEENWIKSALEELVSPPSQGKPGKKKAKEEEEDEDKEENKASDPEKDDNEEKKADDDNEPDADEESAKKSEDGDNDKDDEEVEKAKDSDEPEVDTKDILKSMSEVMHSMHECSNAHTNLLKGLHDKMDECMKALAPKDEPKNDKEEDEMKSILGALLTLKSNQDALNKRLFEVTGKR
jgi:hypothetical protein